MWISVIGGIGTCKKAIADHMEKNEGFKLLSPSDVECSEQFWRQYEKLVNMAHLQKEIQSTSHETDIISIGNIWDTHQVYSKFLLESTVIEPIQYERLDRLYKLMKDLKPPSAFIYLKNNTIMSHARAALTGGDNYSDEDIKHVRDLYDQFVKFVRAPVVEIDASAPMEEVIYELQYGYTSIKASANNESLWSPRLF